VNNVLSNYPLIVEEYDALRAQLAWWLDEHQAVHYASEACAAWFLDGCMAVPTRLGPYAQLYSIAFDLAQRDIEAAGGPAPQEALHMITVPTAHRLCDMARMYAVLTMVAGHGGWSTADKQELAQRVASWRPEKLTVFELAVKIIRPNHVATLLRCAVEASDQHRCVGDEWCAQTALLWEGEDHRSVLWAESEFCYREAKQ